MLPLRMIAPPKTRIPPPVRSMAPSSLRLLEPRQSTIWSWRADLGGARLQNNSNNLKTTQNNFSKPNWRKRENADGPPGPGRQVVGSCLSSCLSCFPIFSGTGQRCRSFLFRPREIILAPANGVTTPAARATVACIPPGLPAGGMASMTGSPWENNGTTKESEMQTNGFMPDYSWKGRLQRWISSLWLRWLMRKPPIVH